MQGKDGSASMKVHVFLFCLSYFKSIVSWVLNVSLCFPYGLVKYMLKYNFRLD